MTYSPDGTIARFDEFVRYNFEHGLNLAISDVIVKRYYFRLRAKALRETVA